MRKHKPEIINKTLEVWQPYYKEPLSNDDVVEIIDNMSDYFALLAKWKKEKLEKESCKISDNTKPKGE